MNGRKCDIAVVGGGLSGGLIALALTRKRPELDILLVEQGDTLGGNHRWSWFESDLPDGGSDLLGTFRKTSWDDGYDVKFPEHSRTLDATYRSLSSDDFDAALRRELPEGSVLTGVGAGKLDNTGLELSDGTPVTARSVIDCRGITAAPNLEGGWQVFMGRHMRTDLPHGVTRPVIMDASVEQHGAYRFVYVLPLGADELFIEDTYYADSPELDRRVLGARIEAYCKDNGWSGEILGNETGVLPVITGGDFRAFQAANAADGVTVAGARGGFVHPLTSYTLPQAVETALAIAEEADLPGAQLSAVISARASGLWRRTAFYRLLGKMLFRAGMPDERYRIFQRFYRLAPDLIARFYAARSTRGDQIRVLSGKPPVPIGGAIKAIFGSGNPLAKKEDK
ncbi:lycopene beta-cyclase CrtY [Altererythrobacter sp. ZODW24]|uniref:lycopene beta-cyclase CrtY n=1 Tax=Altererythrobacter sp. ZODW24 TaxID=2185142 RepID=UPI000DF80FA9|nr:lycopene beta-cyclase CrtY [Altererythrobacter sp. ZODW24]